MKFDIKRTSLDKLAANFPAVYDILLEATHRYAEVYPHIDCSLYLVAEPIPEDLVHWEGHNVKSKMTWYIHDVESEDIVYFHGEVEYNAAIIEGQYECYPFSRDEYLSFSTLTIRVPGSDPEARVRDMMTPLEHEVISILHKITQIKI